MVHQGWRRFLLDRSQFMLLAIVVMGLVAGVSFVNLGIARNSVWTANQVAHARYEEAQRQHAMLVETLENAQRGENIPPKAYDYFALAPAEVTTILIELVTPGENVDGPGAHRVGPPFWGVWWERLVNP
ncbi:MAG: hypothetical protein QG637_1635 [Chloroflexota bacterium]|nr:hypothetical protein [Chloroflexota bacterium]